MKLLVPILMIGISLCFSGCEKEGNVSINLNDTPLEEVSFTRHEIEKKITYPRAINVFNDYIVIMEPQLNDGIYSFWSRSDLKYEFSCGMKGHGRNELINPREDYYESTDSSFFILDNNIEKEVEVNNKRLDVTHTTKIPIPDAINQLVKTGNKTFIAAGLMEGEEKEHVLCQNDELIFFGNYPDVAAPKEKRFIINFKLTAGRRDKPRIWDFYLNKNLIRSYGLDGKLLSKIEVLDDYERPDVSKISEIHPCYYSLKSNKDNIVVLYNRECNTSKLYSETNVKPEVQLWTWSGELKRRIRFNEFFDIFDISEDGVLYAMNSNVPNILYSCDLKKM